MSPDEPQRNILFFLSFFFAREGDEREREEWVCKKRTKEIERGEEKRVDRRRERFVEFRKPRATPFSKGREGRPLPAPRRSPPVPYFIRLRLDSTNPWQPFLRPPIYNSPAMRRSRTKDEGKIPRWHRVPEEFSPWPMPTVTRCEIEQPWLSSLPSSLPFPFFFLQPLYVTHRPSFLRN